MIEALAVGKDRMGQDALNLVQLLGLVQGNIPEVPVCELS